MLAFVGDIHAGFQTFQKIHDEVIKNPEIKYIIQVGDWGYYPGHMEDMKRLELDIPVYFIAGNHEWYPLLRGFDCVTEVHKNLFFVPNGTVLELDERRIVFCGGAGSVDKKWRSYDWFDDENIKDEDIAKLDSVTECDILVAHVPPQSIIQKHFDPHNLLMFDLPITWKDHNADKIENLWKRLNYPMGFFGHMHKTVSDYQCRILNINELFCM